MQRVIILLVLIPFLFACNSGNQEKKSTTKTKVEAKKSTDNSSIDVTFDKSELENEGLTLITKVGSKNTTDTLSGLISKSGNLKADRGTIEDEDAALTLRRARTAFNNGNTYYKDGELDKAAEAYKLSLEYKPGNAKAFYNLGKVHYDMGQKELSLSYYKDAVSINPNDSLSLVAIGLIYYEKADITNAIKFYNKTEEVAPGFSGLYFNRGTMYGQQKKYQLSIEDLTKAIKFDNQNSEAFINRGLAYFYIKQIEMACKDWQEASNMGNQKGTKAVEIYCSGKKAK